MLIKHLPSKDIYYDNFSKICANDGKLCQRIEIKKEINANYFMIKRCILRSLIDLGEPQLALRPGFQGT